MLRLVYGSRQNRSLPFWFDFGKQTDLAVVLNDYDACFCAVNSSYSAVVADLNTLMRARPHELSCVRSYGSIVRVPNA